ncbi:MAG: pyridoxamine 5'-phosphate oxidase family protein [Candidatus Nanopelagicales bacterium]
MDGTTDARTLDDLVAEGDVVMLTTAADGMLARPITVIRHEGDQVSFLVSGSSGWVRMLEDSAVEPVVGVSFADPDDTRYVAMRARARVTHDRARIEELWSPVAKAFFDGPDDPDLRALELEVDAGEWWDGPSTGVGRLVSLVKAAVTGDEPGNSGSVEV